MKQSQIFARHHKINWNENLLQTKISVNL